MSGQPRRVTLAFGKINLSKSSQTVAALRLKAPFLRDTASQTGKADLSSRQFIQATRYRDIGGGFSRQIVEHPAYTLILLQSSRTKNGQLFAEGSLILRLREGADMLSISAILPTGPESVLGDRIQVFVGEADICLPEELTLLGVAIPKYYVDRYMNQEEIDELFDVSVVRQGLINKPRLVGVATSEGMVVRAVGEEAPRRIRLRRPHNDDMA